MTNDAPPLRLLFWETTAGCNLDCVHCRRLEVSHELMKNDMNTEQARRMITDLAGFASCILVFSGGEPLMRPDVFELASLAREKGLIIALASNGTMIDRPMAERIAQTGFHRVSISLDGSDAQTHDRFRQLPGSFHQALGGLRNLREAGVATQVNCTIAKHDADQLGAVLRLAESVGAEAMHYFLLVPVGCGEQIADDQMLDAPEIEQRLHEIVELAEGTALHIKATCAPHYYRIIRQEAAAKGKPMPKRQGHPGGVPASIGGHAQGDHGSASSAGKPGGHPVGMDAVTKGCLAGTSVCFVSHPGDVFPCGYLPVSAGNVTRQKLSEIWARSEVFAQLRDPELLQGKCGVCEFKRVCAGCRARAFYQYGDFLAEEPVCEFQPRRAAAGDS
ncbi:MAG TPA: radical SAM protein [Phycisphaerae bacterium]|nr:radical SAM protein [Phycisphaerae bacterium]